MNKTNRVTTAPTTIVWLRQDLRLTDQPALNAAAARGAVIPVFIWAPEEEGNWAPGIASRWWLHHTLAALDADLRRLGSRLVLRRGPTLAALRALIDATGADAVYWNRRYEPAAIARDQCVKHSLQSAGLAARSFHGSLLYEPWTITKKSGGPFQVFTPFWKTCLAQEPPAAPTTAIDDLPRPAHWPAGDDPDDLQLLPRAEQPAGLAATWVPGSQGARRQLDRFVADALPGYAETRDHIADEGISRLSPHLHFGELSPRQVWAAVAAAQPAPVAAGHDPFLRQLGWREFAHHLLYHFPHTPERPLRTAFEHFAWQPATRALHAWQRGRTGVPLVDAAMRQLQHEGWMPNRARMVVASYLTKNLLISWREGAAWFWDTLVDADLANNTLGWQWTAGCGSDAAPYFRVFNPVSQAEKFDPQGDYIRRWIPELRALPQPWPFKPWEAPSNLRTRQPAEHYPAPLVDLRFSRERALRLYQRMRQEN